jgi:hypothetical protein
MQQVFDFGAVGEYQFAADSKFQFSQAMAALVKRDGVGERYIETLRTHYIVEEFEYFVCVAPDMCVVRIIADIWFIVVAYHTDTAGTWSYYIVKISKYSDEILGQWFGLIVSTAVGKRLSAAGLFLRIDHFITKFLQQFHSRYAYIRKEMVDIAWDKKSNSLFWHKATSSL